MCRNTLDLILEDMVLSQKIHPWRVWSLHHHSPNLRRAGQALFSKIRFSSELCLFLHSCDNQLARQQDCLRCCIVFDLNKGNNHCECSVFISWSCSSLRGFLPNWIEMWTMSWQQHHTGCKSGPQDPHLAPFPRLLGPLLWELGWDLLSHDSGPLLSLQR